MKTYSDNCGVLPETTFHPMPAKGRVLLADRVVHDGRETLVLARDGKLYSYSGRQSLHHFGYSDGLVDALVSLGVFTSKQRSAWSKAYAVREKKRDDRFSAEALGQNMKVLGMKPTKAQQAKLDAILGNMTKERAS